MKFRSLSHTSSLDFKLWGVIAFKSDTQESDENGGQMAMADILEPNWFGTAGLEISTDSLFDSTNDWIHEIEIIFRIEYQPALREIEGTETFSAVPHCCRLLLLLKCLKNAQFFLEFLWAPIYGFSNVGEE